jgi:membrane-bound ClpP family serine protease
MTPVALLFFIGVLFLAAELFVPGVAMGVLGFLCLLIGCAYSFSHFGLGTGLGSVVVAGVLTAATLLIEFVWLPRTRVGKKLFLTKAVVGTSQAPAAQAEDVIGKEAEALTILAPSGYVSVGGQSYEAFCEDGHVARGTRLIVRGVDRTTLKVSKLNPLS